MVESAGDAARTTLKAELKASALAHLEKHMTYEKCDECDKMIKVNGVDQKISLVTTRFWDASANTYVIVCKGTANGLTVDTFKTFRDNMMENFKKMDGDRMTPEELPAVPGTDKIVLMNIKFPFPMTNRSMINAFYFNDEADGSYWQCSSSKGNEALYEQYKSKVGKNVVAVNHLGYVGLKPTDSGVEWSSVNMMDLSGSIPGMLKGKIATRQAKQSIGTINFILTGEKLAD